MESQGNPHQSPFTGALEAAVRDRNSDAVLAAVESAPADDSVIEAIGLRLQLKDYWLGRKAMLAQTFNDTESQPFDEAVKAMLHSADTELARLAGAAGPDETDAAQTSTQLAELRKQRLIDELANKQPEDRVAFMERFGMHTMNDIARPDELVAWTRTWRNETVEIAWDAVKSYREEGGLTEPVLRKIGNTALALNNTYNQLINGVVYQ